MKSIATFTAIALIVGGVPAQAAQDMGLVLNGPPLQAAATGVGARASMTIKLGDKRSVAAPEKLVLGLAAGPILSAYDARRVGGVRQNTPVLAGIALRPGYSASLTVVGHPLATHYTRMGAAEQERKDDDAAQPDRKKKQSTGDKAAWVALVAGGVMVALVGVAVLHCSSGACSD
jgi:hypothetical protein